MPDAGSTTTGSEARAGVPVRLVVLLGAALLVALLGLAGTRSGEASGVAGALLRILAVEGTLAAVVTLAAFGWGEPLRRLLVPDHPDATWLQAPLGLAGLLVLASALGRLGVLGTPAVLGGGLGARLVLLVGLVLAVPRLVGGVRGLGRCLAAPARAPVVLVLAGLPAMAVLLAAAASSPGWLWASEFGGYDALSYHLQLPVEWSAEGGLGRVQGLEHNVYAYLPSAGESLFLLVHEAGGGAVDLGVAAQMVHAATVLLAAVVTGRLARRLVGAIRPADGERDGDDPLPALAGTVATVLVLGTPWTIVVGSLAYNEGFVLALFAAGLLLVAGRRGPRGVIARDALALGLLAGAACGAKLTAAGFVALPLFVVAGLRTRGRGDLALVVVAFDAAAALALAPWLVSNALVCGNPVFPFLTDVLGPAHWTEAQVAAWNAAHVGGGSLAGAWHELPAYGFGPPPDPGEPWAPQWSVLPWLAAAALGLLLARRGTRRVALAGAIVLVLQVGFWLAFTHVKSRFMLPAAVPMAALAAVALAGAHPVVGVARRLPPAAAIALGLGLALWSALPAWIWLGERDGAPAAAIGGADLLDGDAWADALAAPGLSVAERTALIDSAPPAWWTRHAIGDRTHVLMVGMAAPYHHRGASFEYATVWDRGRMSAWMALAETAPDPAAVTTAIAASGVTHVLLDEAMLANWHERRWGDPRLEPDAVRSFLEAHATLVADFPTAGRSLWRLRDGRPRPAGASAGASPDEADGGTPDAARDGTPADDDDDAP